MAWLNGWSYRKTVTITGETGAGADYQVNFSIGDAAGGDFNLESHCTSFPNDIQVTDNDQTTPLDYWVEDLTVDPISMWVEVADDLSSNADICVYYGKSGESSASNGVNTFNLFDHFLGSSVDGTKWTSTGASVTNSEVTISPTVNNNIASIATFGQNYAYRAKAKTTGWWGAGVVTITTMLGFRINSGSGAVMTMGDFPHVNAVQLLTQSDTGANTGVTFTTPSVNVYHIFDVIRNGATNTQLWVNGSLEVTNTLNLPTVSTSVIVRTEGSSPSTVTADWILVRKYASPEPAFLSAGSEETPPIVGIGRLVYGGLVNSGLVGGRLTG